MIELDEIQEPQKSNYTPIVILAVVALLLVVVGFIGYKDYIDSDAKKKVSETKYAKDAELEELKAQVQQLLELRTAETNQKESVLARIEGDLDALKAKIESDSRELTQSPQTEEERLFGSPPTALSEPTINSYPRTTSPSTIPTIDQRTAGLSEKDLFGSPPSNSSAPKTQPSVDPRTGLTADELFGPPPGGISADESALNQAILNAPPSPRRLTPLEQKIKNEPALGSVISYSPEGLVTIDAGSTNYVKEGSQLQIRRGAQVLGKIQVEKVFPNQSVAFFLDSAKITPQVGDQVILSF